MFPYELYEAGFISGCLYLILVIVLTMWLLPTWDSYLSTLLLSAPVIFFTAMGLFFMNNLEIQCMLVSVVGVSIVGAIVKKIDTSSRYTSDGSQYDFGYALLLMVYLVSGMLLLAEVINYKALL